MADKRTVTRPIVTVPIKGTPKSRIISPPIGPGRGEAPPALQREREGRVRGRNGRGSLPGKIFVIGGREVSEVEFKKAQEKERISKGIIASVPSTPRGEPKRITFSQAESRRIKTRALKSFSPLALKTFLEKATPRERADLLKDTNIRTIQVGTKNTVLVREQLNGTRQSTLLRELRLSQEAETRRIRNLEKKEPEFKITREKLRSELIPAAIEKARTSSSKGKKSIFEKVLFDPALDIAGFAAQTLIDPKKTADELGDVLISLTKTEEGKKELFKEAALLAITLGVLKFGPKIFSKGLFKKTKTGKIVVQKPNKALQKKLDVIRKEQTFRLKNVDIKIDNKQITNIVRQEAKKRGIKFDKLPKKQKEFLEDRFKQKIINSPESLIPKPLQTALKRNAARFERTRLTDKARTLRAKARKQTIEEIQNLIKQRPREFIPKVRKKAIERLEKKEFILTAEKEAQVLKDIISGKKAPKGFKKVDTVEGIGVFVDETRLRLLKGKLISKARGATGEGNFILKLDKKGNIKITKRPEGLITAEKEAQALKDIISGKKAPPGYKKIRTEQGIDVSIEEGQLNALKSRLKAKARGATPQGEFILTATKKGKIKILKKPTGLITAEKEAQALKDLISGKKAPPGFVIASKQKGVTIFVEKESVKKLIRKQAVKFKREVSTIQITKEGRVNIVKSRGRIPSTKKTSSGLLLLEKPKLIQRKKLKIIKILPEDIAPPSELQIKTLKRAGLLKQKIIAKPELRVKQKAKLQKSFQIQTLDLAEVKPRQLNALKLKVKVQGKTQTIPLLLTKQGKEKLVLEADTLTQQVKQKLQSAILQMDEGVVKTKQQQRAVIDLATKLTPQTILVPDVTQISLIKQLTKTQQKLKLKQQLKLKQKLTQVTQLTKTQQLIKTKAQELLKQKLKSKFIPKKLNKKKEKKLKILLNKLKSSQSYQVLLRQKGKFKSVSGKLTKGEAKKLGSALARQTLAATFKIRATSRIVRRKNVPFTPSPKIFRTFKIVKGKQVPLNNQWIQKRGKRLSARQEVSEIKIARIKAKTLSKFKGGSLL